MKGYDGVKNKNREDLLKYILLAFENNGYLSYQEIVDNIEHNQNISLDCYDYPATAVKNTILDYGIYSDGKVAGRYKGNKPLFIAADEKEICQRNERIIKWKKISY